MRSEIHAAVPLWINTPLEPPLPSGSPVTERWRLVQKHLPPLAELLDVEIVIMNAEGYCVGGTGPYLRGVGFRMPADNALTYSLRSGQSSMVLTPGKEEVCRTCSGKGACADVANFTGPVVIENEIVAVVQIVAFTDNQRAELLMKSEKAFELISQIIGFAWARGRDVESLPEQPRDDRFPSIIGESKAILRLKAAILKAAGTNATVLIQGESGTGKELIAQAVHDNSPRHTGPFVAINCGAIPESLMESELFGYEPGAFSGANSGGQKGLLEQAHTGTFFLDEVSEMPVSLQVKLLRVLQERVVRRVGGKVNHSVDIRIIAASNRNLRELVAQGAFREDLFFRLDVIPLFVPPLRERQGDIRLLVAHFLQSFSRERGCTYRHRTHARFRGLPVARQRTRTEKLCGIRGRVLRARRPDAGSHGFPLQDGKPPSRQNGKRYAVPTAGACPRYGGIRQDHAAPRALRAAHGREKTDGLRTGDQPCHALPQDGAARHHGEKAREMTEGSPFRMDTAATARPVAIPCMAGHCLFQALDAFSRPAQRRGRGRLPFRHFPPSPPGAKHPGCASSHALPGDMAGRTDRAGISETGEPVRMGGRMDRMPVAISSEIAPCRKQP